MKKIVMIGVLCVMQLGTVRTASEQQELSITTPAVCTAVGLILTAIAFSAAGSIENWKNGGGRDIEGQIVLAKNTLDTTARSLEATGLADVDRAQLLLRKDTLNTQLHALASQRPLLVQLASLGASPSIKSLSIGAWTVSSVIGAGTLAAIIWLIVRMKHNIALDDVQEIVDEALGSAERKQRVVGMHGGKPEMPIETANPLLGVVPSSTAA